MSNRRWQGVLRGAMRRVWAGGLVLLVLAWGAWPAHAAEGGIVRTLRVPDGGIFPQAQVDERGTVHLTYFKGDAKGGDVHYVRSEDGGNTFAPPIRVNSQPGSAIVAGTVRGPQMAVGRNGRVHVAWMGSAQAEPKANGETPMLYTRLNDAGDGFEPQRNVIRQRTGLDGGGSVAADAQGNVYVAWHAPRTQHTEADRWVWIVRSSDEGQTFGQETAAHTQPTGSCACCGMKVFAGDDGQVLVLYRTATDKVNRDMHLLASQDHGKTFAMVLADAWNASACMMSTAAAARGPAGVVAAWETRQQIRFARLEGREMKPSAAQPVPGRGPNRKHPAVAVNAKGQFVIAWTEGTGWNRSGTMVWQAFEPDGTPIAGQSGKAQDLPASSVPAVIALADGTFRIIY